MKLSITQYKRTITIEDPDGDDMNFTEFHENMIRPLLLGMEFSSKTVDKLQIIEDEVEHDHYVDNLLEDGGYIACIPWEQLETQMGKKGYKKFLKWMEGSTCPIGGVYTWDLERYLKGLPPML